MIIVTTKIEFVYRNDKEERGRYYRKKDKIEVNLASNILKTISTYNLDNEVVENLYLYFINNTITHELLHSLLEPGAEEIIRKIVDIHEIPNMIGWLTESKDLYIRTYNKDDRRCPETNYTKKYMTKNIV